MAPSPFPQNQSPRSRTSSSSTLMGKWNVRTAKATLRSVCALTLSRRGTLETYLKWLVANKRKTDQSHHIWNASWERQKGRGAAKKQTLKAIYQCCGPTKPFVKFCGKSISKITRRSAVAFFVSRTRPVKCCRSSNTGGSIVHSFV